MSDRRLVLIRHSKALAGDVDHERPLAPRGFADAAALGDWLVANLRPPDLVVTSTAMRARQTWEGAEAVFGSSAPLVADHRVYVNTVGALLAVVRETPPDVATLVLVGHNPSMAELADKLDDGAGHDAARELIARSYPTSGVACFDIAAPWDKVALGAAMLTSFAVPRG
jgi:phosphohistidine phosphatase